MMRIGSEEEFLDSYVLAELVRRLDPRSQQYNRLLTACVDFLYLYSEDERQALLNRAERRVEARRGVSPALSPVYWPEVVWELHDCMAALPVTATAEDMVSTVLRAGWVPGKW